MKRVMLVFILMFSLSFVLGQACDPEVSLINQDPYPAIPGEYVRLVFQVDNIASSQCQQFSLELLEKYPLIFDSGTNPIVGVYSGFYERDYGGAFLIAPYKIRVDSAALDGDNPIEVALRYGNNLGAETVEFDLNVEDARADFELHVDDYSYAKREMTIEILNIADSDVEALTLEILPQENVKIYGTNRVVVGDLDSNEFTTADFKALIERDEIQIKIIYTDSTGTRRDLIKTVKFDSEYFENTKVSSAWGWQTYTIIIILVVGAIWWYRQRKHKSKHNHRHIKRGSARLG
jgi:hypothetical protein